MAYVVCDVNDGLRPSEATVAVEDVEGRMEFLRVEKRFVKAVGGESCLPIGIIQRDGDDVLIELPHEADSGVNRLWVSEASLRGPGSERRGLRHDPVGSRNSSGAS